MILNKYNLLCEQSGKKYSPEKDRCVNRCCQPNPCFHEGSCQEICDPIGARFNCTCPANYVGTRCELRCYSSCKDVFQNNVTKSGRYVICDGQQLPFYVYCDMESDSKFLWALIQTFSLSHKHLFENKPFVMNHPMNMKSWNVNWTAYRLSLPQMQYLKSQSTRLRVTCNFANEGLVYTDYAIAPLQQHKLFSIFSRQCKWYYHLNIRGIQCSKCTAVTNQREGRSWFINSYASKFEAGCTFDGRPGMRNQEHNFGWYRDGRINSKHRCSSSLFSTTEHWLGISNS